MQVYSEWCRKHAVQWAARFAPDFIVIFNGFAYADWVALSLALRYQLYIFASVKMYVTQHLMYIALGNFFEAGARDELLYLVGSDGS